MYLETKRLILRNLTDDDFNSLYSVLADSDIMQLKTEQAFSFRAPQTKFTTAAAY